MMSSEIWGSSRGATLDGSGPAGPLDPETRQAIYSSYERPGRGFKFSTYATWAIMKNFARSIPDEKHRRERYVTGHEELFEAAPDTRSDEQDCVAAAEQAAHGVNRLLQYLDPREREIIRLRAGLDGAREMTLEEIGKEMGITKERVRQLNVRIRKKLRELAHDQKMEL